ncbi:hypothetical protein MHU86_5508 [Fragilaria crotonensis]|nr:hypothetical protein MHU86_5508 [Fragilaria crotonensis]
MLRTIILFTLISSHWDAVAASPLGSLDRPDPAVVLPVSCPGEGGILNYFSLSLDLNPQGGFNTDKCTSEQMEKLGLDINGLLLDYGMREQGEGDDAVFLAHVCSHPITENRRLGAMGFLFMGGGTCRFCRNDNFDQRRLRPVVHDERRIQENDPNWFTNTYAPELQNILRNAIAQDIVENFFDCLGRGPQVTVTVSEVSPREASYGCI